MKMKHRMSNTLYSMKTAMCDVNTTKVSDLYTYDFCGKATFKKGDVCGC